jgi:transcriptional regulator with XRE-family HTH domain
MSLLLIVWYEAHLRKTTFTSEYAEFCRLLIAAREAAGLSQHDLAKRLGTYRNFVSRYEMGQWRLDIIQVVRICNALGLEPVELMQQLVQALRAVEKSPVDGEKAN